MRTVSIFVASSIIEFEYERIYIGDFIRKYNDNFKPIGNRVRLHMCEDEYVNSQSFYDRLIESSDIFILMIGERLGDFSRHELVDIADKCPNIKKKVVVLNSEKSRVDIPLDLESDIEIKVLGNNKKESLQNFISDLIEDVIDMKVDEPAQPIEENFILSLPAAEDIEVAVLNNIVRRLNDQDFNILVHDDIYDGSENVCVGLLTKSLYSERNRLLEILSKITKSDDLWIFADKYYDTQDTIKIEDSTAKELGVVLNKIIINHRSYPSFYSSIKNLALDFEIRLRRALHTIKTAERAAEQAAFIYILEDHWLIQKSLISGRKTLRFNLWDITSNCTYEKALRKERVICNLLNMYWLSGKWNKHVDAWTKLNQGKFDEFVYEEDDLEEIKVNAKEYNQAFYDFICDKIEIIQKKSIENGWQWLDKEVKQLLSTISDKRCLPTEQLIKVLIYLADAYSTFNETLNKALNLYEEALSIDAEYLKDIVKTQLGGLISIGSKLIDSGNMTLLKKLIIIGQKVTDESDLYYWAIFKLLESAYLQHEGHSEWEEINKQISERLTSQTFLSDNSIVEISLLQQIYLLNRGLQKNEDIPHCVTRINEIFGSYTKYLSYDKSRYGHILISLLSLQSLANQDITQIEQLIDWVDNNAILSKGKFYYDLMFNKATIYTRHGKFENAMGIYHTLTTLYQTDYDIGSSFQNIALCNMHLFNFDGKLHEAENNYLKALSYYLKCGSKEMCGNVYDGLSFCYILQRRFKDAEVAAAESVSIQEYSDDNKYCNYISSLICQGKYLKAVRIYRKHPNKRKVLMLIQIDWEKEIKTVGIDARKFRVFKTLANIFN